MKFPWSFLRRKWIILGHEASAKQLLASYFALLASGKRKVVFTTCQPFRWELIECVKECITASCNPSSILFDSSCNIDRLSSIVDTVALSEDLTIIIYEPPKIPRINHSTNVVAFMTPPLRESIRPFWQKALLKKAYKNEYILSASSVKLRIVISPSYIGLAHGPTGILGEILNLLRRSIVDYGSLTIGDAIDVISYNLGIKKSRARELLGELIERKYVTVENGYIIAY